MTLGEATRIAKNMTGRDVNKMAYVLLGDPAIRLNYPTDYQVKTTTEIDTLHALTVQTIKGYIQSSEGDTATWFNGKLDVTILDKMQQITTRDNDASDEASKVKITYNDYPNTLFAGKTVVKDGLFEYWISIEIPKKQLIEDIAQQLDENQKEGVKFNRDEFRKYAEKKAAEMKSAQ